MFVKYILLHHTYNGLHHYIQARPTFRRQCSSPSSEQLRSTEKMRVPHKTIDALGVVTGPLAPVNQNVLHNVPTASSEIFQIALASF